MKQDAIHAAAAAASTPAASVPPAMVAGASFLGYSPAEWLVWLSIFWIIVQATAFVWERVMRIRSACKERKEKEDA